MTQERIQKILSARGVASRRSAEALIARGEVQVNGRIAALGESADTELDEIRVLGRVIGSDLNLVYVALHKPIGFTSTTRGRMGERTVLELVPGDMRIYPVGRLDLLTSGLIFLTNDGAWANVITHPRYEIEKEYEVDVAGTPRDDILQALRSGIRLRDGDITRPARIDLLTERDGRSKLRIVIHEGKKRQVRLMMAAVGHPVRALKRVRIGHVSVSGLQEGHWRRLSDEEVLPFAIPQSHEAVSGE